MSSAGTARRIIFRTLLVLMATALLLYGGVIVYYMHVERSIVYQPSKVFFAARPDEQVPFSPISLTTADHIKLSGWRIDNCNKGPASQYWILFFHGNSGNVSGSRRWYQVFCRLGFRTLAIDYRGYGNSQGIPSERGFYADARAAFGYLTDVEHVPPDRVIVYGHSLGAAVAVDVAAEMRPAALVIEGALLSIPARGQELYPFLPVKLIAQNRFDAAARIPAVTCPILVLHASGDTVAPLYHSRTLFELAREPKKFIELEGNHGSAIALSADKVTAALRVLTATLQK